MRAVTGRRVRRGGCCPGGRPGRDRVPGGRGWGPGSRPGVGPGPGGFGAGGVPGSGAGGRGQGVGQAEAAYAPVSALVDHLRCEGIQRLVLESASDCWRIWYYLAEAAGGEVWLVNARNVRRLPGRGKSDREDC